MKKYFIFLVALFMMNGAMGQWVPQNSGSWDPLNSVFFTDATTGYVAGWASILKTADSGATWIAQNIPNDYWLYSIYFPDENTGLAVGEGGAIIKTTNGGLNWINLTPPQPGPSFCSGGTFSLSFINVNVGFRAGWISCSSRPPIHYGYVDKTIDGGITWVNVYTSDNDLYSVFFPEENIGFALGTFGTILKTTDGGMNWTVQNSGTQQHLYSIYFPEVHTGYAVGDSGTILKTTDGGTSWIIQNSYCLHTLHSVFFTGEDVGYAVGDSGTILNTNDGGINWLTQTSGTLNNLSSVCFADENTGYVVGEIGTILKTINGGYPVGTSDISSKSKTLNIYPNPSSTVITVEMPNKGSLSILNIYGQELITHQITEPKMTLDISTLPSGIYFVRVSGKRTVEAGKFVKW